MLFVSPYFLLFLCALIYLFHIVHDKICCIVSEYKHAIWDLRRDNQIGTQRKIDHYEDILIELKKWLTTR
jgi:hypothetical protein